MSRIFIDSSVLFSAAYSARGHSRDLLRMALRGRVALVVSDLVLEETKRNLAQTSPENVPLLELVLARLPLEIVHPRKLDVLAATKVTASKDGFPACSGKRPPATHWCNALDCVLDSMRVKRMDLETLLHQKRKEILEIGARYGARSIRVFGSVARGEAGAASDVDFLVELEPGRSLLDLGGLLMDLQELLGCEVHVVTEKGLPPRRRERVLKEANRI